MESEVGSQRTEVGGSTSSPTLTEVRGQKSEDSGQKSEVKGR